MKRFIAGIILFVCVVSLAGCGTMRGIGQDVQTGGRNIEKAAHD